VNKGRQHFLLAAFPYAPSPLESGARCIMSPEQPSKLTIGITPHDIPTPTLIIRRSGLLKAVADLYSLDEATVLVRTGTIPTRAQSRIIDQIIRIVLNHNPLCEITFMGRASPWATHHLIAAEPYSPLRTLLHQPYVDERKYFHRQRPRHPVIKEKIRARIRSPRPEGA
jgi:hypothetical protein